ncbi:MAG TPA: alkaline phosphatase family protein [Chthoniobacterales bacterium]|jgi:arylsulfatase A-like enzyme|nr:alkaline phosphatase family protein [Chthoniobacterales bacterium]
MIKQMRRHAARFLSCACWIVLGISGFVSAFATPPSQDRHVVVVVWDGMRPDFVSEQNTPALWKLAQSGVTFRNHHSVFPSATIVNGTAINTGVYPNRSSIRVNHDYLPQIDARKSIDVESARVVRKGDELSGGKYIAVSTIAELIHNGGGKTAIATAKTVGLLFDRKADSRSGQNIFAGESAPAEAITEIVKMLGTFPPATQPADRDTWTTKALTDVFWEKGIPQFSLLWLSEPDDTEHKTAPGAPAAIAAIKSSDDNLARVLAALDGRNATSTTDIFIVSDHGFSTIARSIDVPKILRDSGFDAVTELTGEPKSGQIMIVGNGGTVLFYVLGHDTAVTRRLVEFLQQTDFAGVIFTREPMEGTFTFDKAKIDNKHGPDVEMSFRWAEDKNQFGVPGMMDGDWQRGAGKGTHATLSKFDMHNMLIAAGPDFRRGGPDLTASGNVDLAPTILQILGMNSPSAMDGRILIEAMTPAGVQALSTTTETIEATKKFPTGTWRQHLKLSRAGSTVYFDEGNGAFTR